MKAPAMKAPARVRQDNPTPTRPPALAAAGSPHERLLALQRSAGNQAVVQLAKATAAKVAVTPQELATLTDAIAKAAHDVVGTPAATDLFPVITAQVKRASPKATAPRHKADDPLAGVYTELYSAGTVAILRRLTPKQRGQVLNSLLDALIPALGGTGTVKAPDAAVDNATAAAADEHLVSKRVKANCEGGWATVRRTLLATFGALEVGPEQAITRANDFYSTLVSAELLGVSGSLVHPDLQAALTAATSWLKARPGVDLDAVRAAMGHPGGFNIRANRNNPLALSEHSFGFAIDLSASLNPNIGKSGALDAVGDAVGTDPRGLTTGGKNAAAVQGVATTLHDASTGYVALMADPALFTARVRTIADGVRTAEHAAKLDDSAATALSTLLRTGAGKAPTVEQVLAAAFDAGTATGARKAAAASLVRLATAWRAANPAKGKRPGASTEATTGSAAAHGFLNLPPTLVAALAGTDAGALTWLGSSSVHDYMHFELPPGRRPALY
jgi:hypothetical protein